MHPHPHRLQQAQQPQEAQQGAGGAGSYVGRVLSRTYRLDRLLVAGGIGSVYLARHLRTGGACALKVLHRESAQNQELYRRFLDEARVTVALRHPHIVQVTDLDQTEDGTPFLVMELLEGEDLQARLDREWRLPLAQVLAMAQQVGAALHAAHLQGVVHRDLKPQNIFLTRTELSGKVTEIAKVVDFGLSKIPRAEGEGPRPPGSRTTRDLLVIGTPRYLCPEAAQGQNSQIDGRADQWSLAVILYRALSGRLPFEGDDITDVLKRVVYQAEVPLQQLAPDVPAQVARAIHQALAKRKEDRFPTMRAFIHALLGPAAGGLMLSSSLDSSQIQALLASSSSLSASTSSSSGSLAAVPPPIPRAALSARSSGKARGRGPRWLRGRRRWVTAAVAVGAVLSFAGVLTAFRALRPAALRPTTPLEARRPAGTRDTAEASLAAAGVGEPGRPRADAQAAAVLKRMAELGAAAGDPAEVVATARRLLRQVPADSPLRGQAEARARALAAPFLERRLQRAREAQQRGDCAMLGQEARAILAALPGQREALLLLVPTCGEAAPAGGGAALSYPPLRPVLEAAARSEGEGREGEGPRSPAQALEQAREAFRGGHDARAMTLSHLAAGGGAKGAAWALYALAACHRGDLARALLAGEQLGPGSGYRELLQVGCPAAGE